jgi:hypothetical protein
VESVVHSAQRAEGVDARVQKHEQHKLYWKVRGAVHVGMGEGRNPPRCSYHLIYQ